MGLCVVMACLFSWLPSVALYKNLKMYLCYRNWTFGLFPVWGHAHVWSCLSVKHICSLRGMSPSAELLCHKICLGSVLVDSAVFCNGCTK